MELRGKKVAVLGMGDDGMAMVEALAKVGAQVTGFGTASEAQIQRTEKQLGKFAASLRWADIPEDGLMGFDVIVHSPGGGRYLVAGDYARKHGISVLSDLDLAAHFMQAPIIAVTGTNGKSTTVAILDEMLKKQKYKVAVTGGDFGRWGERISDRKQYDFYLLELSSQRLENSSRFHPHIAVLLNLFPAHASRHPGGLPHYLDAKAKVFAHQTREDFLVHEASARNVRELIRQKKALSQSVMFSLDHPVEAPGVYRHQKDLVWLGSHGEIETYPLSKAKLKTPTFHLNFMAAMAVARLCQVEPKSVQFVLENFSGLPCRMQLVRKIGEVKYYDDSRATNVGATAWALSSFNRPTVWIAGGGVEKDAGLENLRSLVKGRVKLLILVGSEKEKMAPLFEDIVPIHLAEDLKEAVTLAHQKVGGREAVLFSPACPPDLYTQGAGKARGWDFQKLVKALPEKLREVRRKPTFTRI